MTLSAGEDEKSRRRRGGSGRMILNSERLNTVKFSWPFFARKTFSQRKKGKKERRSPQTAFIFRGKCCGEQEPQEKGRWCRISSRGDALNRCKKGVALALLDADGPTGTFSQSGELLPW